MKNVRFSNVLSETRMSENPSICEISLSDAYPNGSLSLEKRSEKFDDEVEDGMLFLLNLLIVLGYLV
jgi:hypothetical protein